MADLISVIIVNWNGKRWLEKCLDSLRVQTYKNFEVIFVDNASTDDSVEFVEKNYPEVVIVKSDKNLGFAGGNNLGVSKARGEYVLLLNSDTWCDSNFLEKIVAGFHENKCDVFGVTETGYENPQYKHYVMSLDPFGHSVTLGSGMDNANPFYISGACVLCSKSLYLKTGGLDEDFFLYCEEVDWFWRLHLLKMKIYQDKNIFVYHAGGGSIGSGIKYQTFLWRNQNTLQMLLKNYAWYNFLWVLPVYFVQNIFEILTFLILLKPKVAWSYVEGWWFNLRNLKRTLKKRKWVQEHRAVGDWEVMKNMYLGLGKAYHLLRFLRAEKNMKRILEIGCGQGFNTYQLSKKYGTDVTGVDLFEQDIEIAKKRYPKVNFHVMNVEQLAFNSGFFDEIYAMDILEHVNDLSRVLSECARVLKVSGKFFINVPAEKSEAWLLKLRPTYFEEIHHVRIFKNSDNEMEKLLGDLNFKVLKKKPRGFLQHIDLYWLFTRTKNSSTQLGIGNWRDTKASMFVHLTLLFFDFSILQTPLKWIPIWIVTLPVGLLVSFFGNKVFPKSFYYEFQKLS